jgi:hypothetical protein
VIAILEQCGIPEPLPAAPTVSLNCRCRLSVGCSATILQPPATSGRRRQLATATAKRGAANEPPLPLLRLHDRDATIHTVLFSCCMQDPAERAARAYGTAYARLSTSAHVNQDEHGQPAFERWQGGVGKAAWASGNAAPLLSCGRVQQHCPVLRLCSSEFLTGAHHVQAAGLNVGRWLNLCGLRRRFNQLSDKQLMGTAASG